MGRKYARKFKKVKGETIRAAIKYYKDGNGNQRETCFRFGLTRSLFQKYLKYSPEDIPEKCTQGRKPIFTKEMEEQIVSYCLALANRFYAMTRRSLSELAYQLAVQNGVPNKFKDGVAGEGWVNSFLRRHRRMLSLRTGTPTSLVRITEFNREAVYRFFDLLVEIVNAKGYEADTIFNMDESGVTIVPTRAPKRIARRGVRTVPVMVPAERGRLCTVICSFNASGSRFIPPMFVLPISTERIDMSQAPANSICAKTNKGWSDSTSFYTWLKHFRRHCAAEPTTPVLLILDNHGSHISYKAVRYCRSHSIDLITLPPYSTHKVQPLDIGFFSPLKSKYSEYILRWLTEHPMQKPGIHDIPTIFRYAFEDSAKPETAINSFSKCGIWQLDPITNTFGPNKHTFDTEFDEAESSEQSDDAPGSSSNSDSETSDSTSDFDSDPDGNALQGQEDADAEDRSFESPVNTPTEPHLDQPGGPPVGQPREHHRSQPGGPPVDQPRGLHLDQPRGPPVDQPRGLHLGQPRGPPVDQPRGLHLDQPRGLHLDQPRGPSVDQPRGLHLGQPRGPPLDQPRGLHLGQPRGPPVDQPRGLHLGQPRGPPVDQPRGLHLGQPRGPPVDQPRGPPVDQPRGPPVDQPRGPPVDQPRGPPVDQPRGPPVDQPRGPPVDQPRGPPVDQPRGPPVDKPRGPPVDQPRGPPVDQPRGPPVDQPRGPPVDQPRGPPRDQQHGLYLGQPRGPPVDQPCGSPVDQQRGPPVDQPRGPPVDEPRRPPVDQPSGHQLSRHSLEEPSAGPSSCERSITSNEESSAKKSKLQISLVPQYSDSSDDSESDSEISFQVVNVNETDDEEPPIFTGGGEEVETTEESEVIMLPRPRSAHTEKQGFNVGPEELELHRLFPSASLDAPPQKPRRHKKSEVLTSNAYWAALEKRQRKDRRTESDSDSDEPRRTRNASEASKITLRSGKRV